MAASLERCLPLTFLYPCKVKIIEIVMIILTAMAMVMVMVLIKVSNSHEGNHAANLNLDSAPNEHTHGSYHH